MNCLKMTFPCLCYKDPYVPTVLGGLGLWGGSELLISGAVGLATFFGVSERVIGITIVSVGTSVPELAASVIAVIEEGEGHFSWELTGV